MMNFSVILVVLIRKLCISPAPLPTVVTDYLHTLHFACDPCREGSMDVFNNVKQTTQFSAMESGLD